MAGTGQRVHTADALRKRRERRAARQAAAAEQAAAEQAAADAAVTPTVEEYEAIKAELAAANKRADDGDALIM